MNHVTAVNQSYYNLYKKLGKFSYAPYDWSLVNKSDQDALVFTRFIIDMALKSLLAPVLVPATAITFTLSLLSAVLAALTHPFALAGAAIADVLTSENNTAFPEHAVRA